MAGQCKVMLDVFGELQCWTDDPAQPVNRLWSDAGFIGTFDQCDAWIAAHAEAQLMVNGDDGSYQTIAVDAVVVPPWQRVLIGSRNACAMALDPAAQTRALIGMGFEIGGDGGSAGANQGSQGEGGFA